MGLIAKILDSFTGNDGEPSAKVEIYKGDNATAKIYNPPGVDARPLDGDRCFTEDSKDTEGGKDILGFIDPVNNPVAEKGEYRVYSRDENGNIKATIWIKKDGDLSIVADKDLIVDISGSVFINVVGKTTIDSTDTLEIIAPLIKVTGPIECSETIDAVGNISSEADLIGDSTGAGYSNNYHFHLANLSYNTQPPFAIGAPGTPKPGTSPTGDSSGNLLMNGKYIDMSGADIKSILTSTGTSNFSVHYHNDSVPAPGGPPI